MINLKIENGIFIPKESISHIDTNFCISRKDYDPETKTWGEEIFVCRIYLKIQQGWYVDGQGEINPFCYDLSGESAKKLSEILNQDWGLFDPYKLYDISI